MSRPASVEVPGSTPHAPPAAGPASSSPAPASTAADDWDLLFKAVRQTLREALQVWPDSGAAPLADGTPPDLVAQARATGFGCADALDQLHESHAQGALQRGRLEREIAVGRAALAQARRELLGTEAEVRRARHLALHDGLTLLPNRECIRQRLEAALAPPEAGPPTVALLYLDLDGFKRINDTHGHDIGDELLRIVAARLVRAVRADDVVSRFGGDEFVCLLADMPDRDSLGQLANKLWDAVSAPVRLGSLTLVVQPSIGIAQSPADGGTAEALLKAADAAMYHAKRMRTGHEFADARASLRGLPTRAAAPRES